MNVDNDVKGAEVKFPPPLIFVLVMLVSYGIHYVYPLGLGSASWLVYLGCLDIALGLLIVLLAALNFKKAQTNIEPWKPTSNIVSTGIFAYSRNPIYLAFCFVQVGISLCLNSTWVLVSCFVSAYLVYVVAIKKEETYLELKFGSEYLNYKNNVRRWL